ncbi:cell division protein FtsH [Hafnia alvei FB1]|uniref:Cell division protein FtsH n=1 Tax=Hafnia alvei FB1 TaxID=1453496 RepID=A0A097QYW6_HAFAL|nr:YqjK-like family protein [Hafnia alvei]AIU71674.1 cell division protein FtsH [Hafnia alvei FB1]TBL61716.1 cell division protein FtsH [Hafnia alvei]
MSRNRQELALEKARLLRQVQQQRLDLAGERRAWLQLTAKFDHRVSAVMRLRKFMLLGSSLLALYGARHPAKTARWTRRVFSVWGVVKVVRKAFYSKA